MTVQHLPSQLPAAAKWAGSMHGGLRKSHLAEHDQSCKVTLRSCAGAKLGFGAVQQTRGLFLPACGQGSQGDCIDTGHFIAISSTKGAI